MSMPVTNNLDLGKNNLTKADTNKASKEGK